MIVLRAKNVEFDVTYINLREKPDWFLKISPHGKVPVLVVDEKPLFESNAIAEFLDENAEPRLHPEDSIKRARNRAWVENIRDFSEEVRGLYYANTKEEFDAVLEKTPGQFQKMETAIKEDRDNDGPYFNGPDLCMVDASYAPFLRRFKLVDRSIESGLLEKFPLLSAWADALEKNDAISGSLPANFEEEFLAMLQRNNRYVCSIWKDAAA
ncbi:MAG: glutathione S-transferase family protein [Rhodospirillales bacterium]|nr:glutathione S-transferase family protein [Rhodospirillaceae bacterium]MBT7671874.1 glutathione S-transferase family protein [Pseudomonadota bacterium]MBT7768642.1 glutathione S-transferase family protein [Rhodospirillales bacterium]MBT5036336.1 glutathione S-transferase family protein [Rhodospirillaceae bacterium]MBT6222238.1 glutathione S-transferase family protein [Rhodospirillaceae bacterium]